MEENFERRETGKERENGAVDLELKIQLEIQTRTFGNDFNIESWETEKAFIHFEISFLTCLSILSLPLIPLQSQRISHEVGWNHQETVDKLEAKRKVKQQAYHERKVAANKRRAAAITSAGANLEPINQKLAVYGL